MENNKAICVDFIITKASTNPLTKERRWAATVSKFEADSQQDEVTKEFYEYATKKIESGEYPRPALVISHFDDPRYEKALEPVPDEFVAGWATKLYIDGDKPKAKGVFADNPLGDALYEAVKADIASDNPKIRISMAFRATTDGLEKTELGVTRFLKGQIRHFAVTRYPVVRETDFMVEKSLTRRDDAESIVGAELAEKLEAAYRKITKNYKDKSESDAPLYEKQEAEDVGKCISEKLKEGWPRKKALATCLEMSRSEMSKSEFMEWIEELDKSIEDFDIYEDDVEAVNLPKKAGTCYYALIAQGIDPQVALDRCYSAEARDMRDEAMEEQETKSEQPVTEEIITPVETEVIVESAEEKSAETVIEEPVAEEKSETPVTEEPIEEKPIEGEPVEEKSEQLSEELIIAEKAEESSEVVEPVVETKEKSEQPSETEVVTEEIAYPYQYETPSGVFKSHDNVDWIFEPIIEAKADVEASESSIDDVNTEKTPVVSEVDTLINLFKSTLNSAEFDKKQKIEVVNGIFEKLSTLAYEEINKTQPSNADLQNIIEEAVEKAVVDAVKPLQAQIDALLLINQELTNKSVNRPSPKRLVFKGTNGDMIPQKDKYSLEEVITKSTQSKITY